MVHTCSRYGINLTKSSKGNSLFPDCLGTTLIKEWSADKGEVIGISPVGSYIGRCKEIYCR